MALCLLCTSAVLQVPVQVQVAESSTSRRQNRTQLGTWLKCHML
jgi:hypothetical protein